MTGWWRAETVGPACIYIWEGLFVVWESFSSQDTPRNNHDSKDTLSTLR